MKKVVLLGLSLVFSALTFAQKPVNISFTMSGCSAQDSVFVLTFNGLTFNKVKGTAVVDGKAILQLPSSDPKMYYFSTNNGQHMPVILGSEPKVVVAGTCSNMATAQLTDSKINTDYQMVKLKMTQINNKSNQMMRQLQQARNDADAQQEIAVQFADLDKERIALFAEAKALHPYLGKCVAPNTYLSYQNNKGEYANEIEYYINEYFRFVDWEDPMNAYNPWIYETMRGYATTLQQVRLPDEQIGVALKMIFDKIPEGSNTKKLAVGAAITALSAKAGPAIGEIMPAAEAVFSDDPLEIAALEAIKQSAATFIIGAEAPNFELNNLEGKPMELKDLRGKLILLDFWASWCGPCRRENPNVVKLYDEYKDKGFDILGVSLDRDQARWEQAVEKDGLTWHHVSDLKGWKSAAAKLYSVSSIPATLLIDKEGKIVARNLRGAALEAKVAELLGDSK